MIKLEVTFDNIDYTAIAERFASSLKENAASDDAPYGVKMLSKLPQGFIKGAVAAMPESVKEEMAVYLLRKYKDKLVAGCEKLAADNGISAQVRDVSFTGTL